MGASAAGRPADRRAPSRGPAQALADILPYAHVECFTPLGQPPNPGLRNIAAWRERVGARPSAKA